MDGFTKLDQQGGFGFSGMISFFCSKTLFLSTDWCFWAIFAVQSAQFLKETI